MKNKKIAGDAFFWALQGVCALHRKPFSNEMARKQLAAPHTTDSFSKAALAYGFEASSRKARPENLHKETFPLLVWLSPKAANTEIEFAGESDQPDITPALILQADTSNVLVAEADNTAPRTISLSGFNQRYSGHITRS